MHSQHGASSSVGRASDCGSECRGFEPHLAPFKKERTIFRPLFFVDIIAILFMLPFPFAPSLLVRTLFFAGWLGSRLVRPEPVAARGLVEGTEKG